jgi:uncharacterized protein DUF2786
MGMGGLNSEREKVKERVAKLLNMTVDNGASENEAMTAAKRAAELMAHYDIEASELSLRDTKAIAQIVVVRKYGNVVIGSKAAVHIARLCDCMIWYKTSERRGSKPTFTFFGLPRDAEVAAYLFDLVSNGILAETDIYKASSTFEMNKTAGTHGRVLIHSFIEGMDDRISARLDALRREKHQTIHEATGRSLVVSKEELIERGFKATGIKLVSIRRPGPLSLSSDAYRSGNLAGDRIPLSPGVATGGVVGVLT